MISSHPIMAKIVEISDLGLHGTFESLSFKHISHRERPSRKGSNVRNRAEGSLRTGRVWGSLGDPALRNVDRIDPF